MVEFKTKFQFGLTEKYNDLDHCSSQEKGNDRVLSRGGWSLKQRNRDEFQFWPIEQYTDPGHVIS